MKILILALLAVVVASAPPVLATPPDGGGPDRPVLYGSLILGYYGGAGFHASGTVTDLARGLPVDIRFGIGRAGVEPGKALDARRVFINDATNGVPEEAGRLWDFRLDVLYPVRLWDGDRSFVFVGPRHSRFTANFNFVGGNEDFDVISRQWGFGAGMETSFPVSRRVELVVSAGADYFVSSTLSGHDTSYSPDGDDANARDGYGYDDADDSINQPKVEPRLMTGVSYRF